jgi:hypothetical protein
LCAELGVLELLDCCIEGVEVEVRDDHRPRLVRVPGGQVQAVAYQ